MVAGHKQLTDDQRETVCQLRDLGFSVRIVAKHFGVSRRAVMRITQRAHVKPRKADGIDTWAWRCVAKTGRSVKALLADAAESLRKLQ